MNPTIAFWLEGRGRIFSSNRLELEYPQQLPLAMLPHRSFAGRPKPALTIGRPRVASFLVYILARVDFFGKAPVISQRRWLL
jgi:hypothetical protein